MKNVVTAPSKARHTAAGSVPQGLLAIVLLSLALLSSGCSESESRNILQQVPNDAEVGELDLAIVGYNYTNRAISVFSVNGVGGGNVALSGPKGGGGGIVCCAKFWHGPEPSTYVIRWDASSCRFHERPPTTRGEVFELHYFYSEKQVKVRRNGPTKPNYFEVHFFPDGSVKVQVTAELSAPLMALSPDREEMSAPQCPGNVRPTITY